MALSMYGSKLSQLQLQLQLPHGLTADEPLFVPPHIHRRHISNIDHEEMSWQKTQ